MTHAHAALVWPMATLALLTFAVLILAAARRIGAARAGRVRVRDFRLGESASVPDDVAVVNRNYMNLLELPILFYVLCLLAIVEGRHDAWLSGLAWAYVALRALHSVVHIGYNNVLHRLYVFAVGNVVLAVMWICYLIRG